MVVTRSITACGSKRRASAFTTATSRAGSPDVRTTMSVASVAACSAAS
jgi:hypothetical protein